MKSDLARDKVSPIQMKTGLDFNFAHPSASGRTSSSSSSSSSSAAPRQQRGPEPAAAATRGTSTSDGTTVLLTLARLLGQAPIRLVDGVYFSSLPWRVQAFPLHVGFNVLVMATVYGIMFTKEFSQTEIPDFIRLKIHVTAVMTMICSVSFSCFCWTRQHPELPLILNRLKMKRSRREVLIVSLNVLGFAVLCGSYIHMFDFMGAPYAAAMIEWAFFGSFVLPAMCGVFTGLIKSVRAEYRALNDKMEAMLLAKRKMSWDAVDMADEMFTLHSLHEETTRTLRDICHCFGPQLSVQLLWCLVFSVVDLHHTLPPLFSNPPAVDMSHTTSALNLVQLLALTVPFVTSCHEASEEGNNMQLLLQGFFDIRNLTPRELREVKRFMPILQEDRVQVHLIGIITADNGLLISIVSTIVTYLIIVLQFKSSPT